MNNLSGEVTFVGKNIGEVTIATSNADGSMRSLNDILADCRVAFSGLSESEKAANAEALVGKNAMSGFLALMNSSETDIYKLRGAIENCDGASESMAETMQDNLNGQLTILKSQLEELAISFGDILMPTIRKIVSAVQQLVDKLNSMDEGTRETIIKIGLLAASIGPLLIVLGKTISTVGTAMRGFSSLAKGVRLLITHVGSAMPLCASSLYGFELSCSGSDGVGLICESRYSPSLSHQKSPTKDRPSFLVGLFFSKLSKILKKCPVVSVQGYKTML